MKGSQLKNSKGTLGETCEQTIKGNILFASKNQFNLSDNVAQAYVELTGLREWLAENPIKKERDSENSNSETLQSYSVDLNQKDTGHVLFADEQYEIKVEHIVEPPDLAISGLSIKHNCCLKIVFKSEVCFDEALRMVEELAAFFSLCRGLYSGIESLELKFTGCLCPVKCHTSFLEGSKADRSQTYPVPFSYSSIQNDLQTLLDNWIHLPEDVKHVEVILASLMCGSWNMPFDLVFFALSQVLEVLSKKDVDLHSLPQERYEKYKQEVLDSIENDKIKNGHKNK